MKKILVILSAALLIVAGSCTSKKEQQLREQHLKDSFNTLLGNKTTEVETLNAQLEEIDNSLAQIVGQYEELRNLSKDGQTQEVSQDRYTHITDQINAVSDLLAKEKAKVQSLSKSVQSNNSAKNKALQSKVDELNQKIAQQEEIIATLNSQMNSKDASISDLNAQIAKLNNESKKNKAAITELEDERYAGYFTVGTKKELSSAGLISKKGGFIGIGKTIVMAENGNLSSMQKIDIRNVTEIPLTGQKVKFITTHPRSSYSLEGDPNKPSSLKILSYEDFWRSSRCLIIMVQ